MIFRLTIICSTLLKGSQIIVYHVNCFEYLLLPSVLYYAIDIFQTTTASKAVSKTMTMTSAVTKVTPTSTVSETKSVKFYNP